MIFHQFDDRQELAIELAHRVSSTLSAAIAKKAGALLAVSGGSTPKRFFSALSAMNIDWEKVTITLVDERWVDETNARSNTRLVKKLLLTGNAAKADFVSLFVPDIEFRPEMPELENLLSNLSFPFDAAILGMGTDGHTASFFPGGDNLANALSPDTNTRLCTMLAPGANEPRITFTLPVLVASGFLALHIEGQDKRSVLEAAKRTGQPDKLPIRHILNHAEHLETFWAP